MWRGHKAGERGCGDLAVERARGRPPARRLRLCGAVALAASLLSLSLAGSARAAAPPTGDAGASIAAAPAGAVAGSVDAGGFHTCGIRTNGTARLLGRRTAAASPPRPAGTFTAVSAGGAHSCGIRTSGTVACWGANTNGQATPPAGTFTAVSAGGAHTCGVQDERHRRLLGPQRQRPVDPAGGRLHRGERRQHPQLRGAGRTAPSPAGATTPTARPPRPPAPSRRSAPAAPTPAG